MRAITPPIRIGLVSTSDRASAGAYQDEGIPALKAWLLAAVLNPIEFVERLIPDEQALIEQTLIEHVEDVFFVVDGGAFAAQQGVGNEHGLAVATPDFAVQRFFA